jgi:hypothetical protein
MEYSHNDASDNEKPTLAPSSPGSLSPPDSQSPSDGDLSPNTDASTAIHPYDLLKEWSNKDYPAVLSFPLCSNQWDPTTFELHNIFDFTSSAWARKRIYFDTTEYPPNLTDKFNSTSFHKL